MEINKELTESSNRENWSWNIPASNLHTRERVKTLVAKALSAETLESQS